MHFKDLWFKVVTYIIHVKCIHYNIKYIHSYDIMYFSLLHSSYVQNNGPLITILYYINSPFPNSLPEGKFPNFSFSINSFTIFYLFQVTFSTFKTVPHLIFAFLTI